MFTTHKTAQKILPTFYEALVVGTIAVIGLGIVIVNSKVPSQTYSYYFSIAIALAALATASFHCGKKQERKKNGQR